MNYMNPFRFSLCHNPHQADHLPFQTLLGRRNRRHLGPRIYYEACPHQDKYPFIPNSPLQNYLENHCEGFVKDDQDKYTINYLVFVLLANWKTRKLFSKKQDSVLATSYIKKAFRTTSAVIGIRGLRRRIISQLDTVAEDFFMRIDPDSYLVPLWCLDESDIEFLSEIMEQPRYSLFLSIYVNICKTHGTI